MRVGEKCAPGRNPRVLVIEDDEYLRELLAELLGEVVGDDVLFAIDPDHVAPGLVPELVVTDLFGPNAHDAHASAGYLRAVRSRFPASKILLLSAHGWVDAKAPPSDVDDAVAKPFDLDELLERICVLLEPAPSGGLRKLA